MRITIDYDGSTTLCTVVGALISDNPTANANISRNFLDLDYINQAHVIAAFKCIENHWKKENKL